MKISLLKSFGRIGFNIKIEENGEVVATDNAGNTLQEGEDYIVEDEQKPTPIEITLSNGSIIYAPPK